MQQFPPTDPTQPPPPYYPPQPPYPMQPPYYPYQPPPRPMNRKAQQAQMFGVFGLLIGAICGIPAVILGLLALSEIQHSGEDGTKQANTGLLLGFISLGLTVAYYLYFVH